jgi:flagellar hook-basal body complex protein FliE
MTTPAISSISSAALAPLNSTVGTAATASADGGSGFQSALVNALGSVQSTQATADQLNIQAATGNLPDLAQATIASTRAQVEVQLVSAVRNQAVDAFNNIMNMSA